MSGLLVRCGVPRLATTHLPETSLFDSHCHLTDIADPASVLEETLRSGVRSVLTCGYDDASNRAVRELVTRHPSLPFSLGLHPWFADQAIEPVLQSILDSQPVAVGEAGLDLWGEVPVHPIERQMQVLEAQLDLARRLDLPVTLHSRKAIAELLDAVRRYRGVRGALHAFSGSYEQARAFVDLGLYIGVGGAVTRSRAKRVRRCAVALPLDCLVVETDSPAIGLDGVEPPHVRPWHVKRVAAALAELRGIALEEVERQTDDNVVKLFGERARGSAISEVEEGSNR